MQPANRPKLPCAVGQPMAARVPMNALHHRSAKPSSSILRAAVVSCALLSGLACSAILKPRDDVARCGTADDCPGTGNERYVPVCQFDAANANLSNAEFDKICLAVFNPNVSCDDSGITNNQDPFKVALATCAAGSCEADQLGTAGCPPDADGKCGAGLELDDYKGTDFCNDPDSDQPVIPSNALSGAELSGQDVRDMYCKSYFCDDTFVCNNDTKKCVPCDPKEEYGLGGCGIVYQAGPAPAYVLGDSLDDVCDPDDRPNTQEPHFGDTCG